jgi:hypothetical protein
MHIYSINISSFGYAINYLTHFVFILQLPFVIGYEGEILPKEMADEVHKVIQTLHLVNYLLRADEFRETDLQNLDVQVRLLQSSIRRVFGKYSASDLATPKLHSLIHFSLFIRMYGAPRNWDTSTFELFHRTAAKLPWNRINKHQNADAAMLRVVEARNVIAQLLRQDEDAATRLRLADVARKVGSLFIVYSLLLRTDAF